MLIFLLLVYFTYYFGSFLITPFVIRHFCSIIGLRGSGKSNLASMLAWFWIHIMHQKVFSNFPIKDAYEYDVSDLGTYMISHCVLILDEAGIDMSNRKILEKSMRGIKENNRKFWKLTRHYHIPHVFIFSQAKDYDVTLRRLCDNQFIITHSSIKDVSLIHLIRQYWDSTQDGDDVTVKVEIMKFPHLRVYRPYWFKYYDSYEAPVLPYKEFNTYNFDSGNDSDYDAARSHRKIPRKYKKFIQV